MAEMGPYDSAESCVTAASTVWQALGRDDMLEAFAAHPKIGDVESLRNKYAKSAFERMSEGEQQGVDEASEATIQGLAEGNQAYEDRYHHIFIVCATGKTADEMLVLLQARLHNEAGKEFKIAAGEQEKITEIRLRALLERAAQAETHTGEGGNAELRGLLVEVDEAKL